MKKNEHPKYFIPVNGIPVEVDETVYRAYYQPIWITRFKAQKNCDCHCPKSELWLCDGICPGCSFYLPKNMLSLDNPAIEESADLRINDTLTDFLQVPELIALEKEVIDEVHEAIHRLDPQRRKLCMLMMNHSEREAAELLGVSRATVRRRWKTVKEKLKILLKDKII